MFVDETEHYNAKNNVPTWKGGTRVRAKSAIKLSNVKSRKKKEKL